MRHSLFDRTQWRGPLTLAVMPEMMVRDQPPHLFLLIDGKLYLSLMHRHHRSAVDLHNGQTEQRHQGHTRSTRGGDIPSEAPPANLSRAKSREAGARVEGSETTTSLMVRYPMTEDRRTDETSASSLGCD